MQIKSALAASAVAVVASTAGAVDAFTDFAAWEAAAGNPVTTDDFASYGVVDLALGANDFFNGYTVTLAGTGTGGAEINGASNFVFTVGGDLESITFDFDQNVTGFGADWLNSFVSNGLTVTINGEAFNVEDSVAAPNFDFIGYADGAGFGGASITVTNAGGSTEFAAISNLYFAVVPAPAGLGALALGGLLATRRRR
ncbi:MAG: hypothetical protein AAF995_00160 [Planctomycetota bacterium]